MGENINFMRVDTNISVQRLYMLGNMIIINGLYIVLWKIFQILLKVFTF